VQVISSSEQMKHQRHSTGFQNQDCFNRNLEYAQSEVSIDIHIKGRETNCQDKNRIHYD